MSWPLRIAVLAAVLLVPWPDCQQHQQQRTVLLAAGQGVALTGSQLLAASNVDLTSFEDSLALSADFTGATKRRPSRPKSSFNDALSLAQLQLANYHVASAPIAYTSDNTQLTPGQLNYVPKVRDQGQCSTCVGHAVASAVEAAAGAATRQNAVGWDVSPQSLYYCSDGGRTCATGWDISEALSVVRNSPQLVRPTSCGLSGISEPDVGDWEGFCDAASSSCPFTNPALPWLKCSYKSLSSFWQIQQHIRNHGAVVTRMVVNDDFKPFFSPSGRPGASYGAYTASSNAKGLYGHAVLLIGYDNANLTWTMLNSWGKCTEGWCESTTGITADGQFVLKMGQAGVGSPEDTYGVVCEPTPGTDLDPHEVRPWARQQRRKVSLAKPEDLTNLTAPCFLYAGVEGDTAASIADAFRLDLRLFVRDNVDIFQLVTVNASFGNDTWTAADFTTILDAVQSTKLPAAIDPFFTCTRTTSGDVSTCSLTSGFDGCIGLQTCVLSYSEQNVTTSPVGFSLRVCNISAAPGQFDKVAYFDDPRVSQPRALRSLLNTLSFGPQTVPVPADYCNSSAWDKLDKRNQQPPAFVDRWVRSCDNDSYVTDLDISITAATAGSIALEIDVLLDALLTLERLQRIRIITKGGELPKQLGALASLQVLQIDYWCMKAALPRNWGRSWPNFKSMYVRQYASAKDDALLDPDCGLTGELPYHWGTQMRNLEYLDLSDNSLTGGLPASFSQMSKLRTLLLHGNKFGYKIPPEWSGLSSLYRLDLSSNNLEGGVPLPFQALQTSLGFLTLDDNPNLSGCVPLSPFTTLTYANTRITGLCSSTRDEVETQQSKIVAKLLSVLLNSDRDSDYGFAVAQFVLRAEIRPLLHDWIAPGQSVAVIPSFAKRGSISVTLQVIEGTVSITALKAVGAALDLRALPSFVSALPKLQSFSCNYCIYYSDFAPASVLPPDLPGKAPASFTTLSLTESKLSGGLPQEWGSWSTIKEIDLANNSFSGPLPGSWSNMSSLAGLSLRFNQVTGSLPSSWGDPGSGLPAGLQLDAAGNAGLTGSVPSSWARFTGFLQFGGTNISGCVPDQLVYSVVLNTMPNTPCSTVSKQVTALRALKPLLGLSWWDTSQLDAPALPSPGLTAPMYCRNWRGVKCDSANNVIELDLSNINAKRLLLSAAPQQAVTTLGSLVPHLVNLKELQVLLLNDNAAVLRDSTVAPSLRRLTKLRVLNVANSGLSGQLPPALGTLVNLEQLVLSRNPNIKGQLPTLYAGLVSLQLLDVSGCGLSGGVPPDFASLQSLQVFKAGNNVPGLSGTLPDDLGIIESLVQLDISNAKLTGQLPAAWADPFSLGQVAAAAVSRAQAAAAQASAQSKVSAAAAAATDGNTDAQAEVQARQAAVAALQRRAEAVAARTAGSGAVSAAASSNGWLGLMKLQVLALPGNGLSGQLPVTYAGMSELRVVDLSNNNITGGLPVRWAALTSLQKLLLKGNKLSGSLPNYYARLSQLQQVDLSSNQFSGSLPTAWASLSKATQVSLASNKLTGVLPATWFGMRSAATIDLSNNLLTGTFPAPLGVMADRTTHKLTQLVLSDNPCMNNATLLKRIAASNITAGGYVTVQTTCCSAAANANKALCKKKVKKTSG